MNLGSLEQQKRPMQLVPEGVARHVLRRARAGIPQRAAPMRPSHLTALLLCRRAAVFVGRLPPLLSRWTLTAAPASVDPHQAIRHIRNTLLFNCDGNVDSSLQCHIMANARVSSYLVPLLESTGARESTVLATAAEASGRYSTQQLTCPCLRRRALSEEGTSIASIALCPNIPGI